MASYQQKKCFVVKFHGITNYSTYIYYYLANGGHKKKRIQTKKKYLQFSLQFNQPTKSINRILVNWMLFIFRAFCSATWWINIYLLNWIIIYFARFFHLFFLRFLFCSICFLMLPLNFKHSFLNPQCSPIWNIYYYFCFFNNNNNNNNRFNSIQRGIT